MGSGSTAGDTSEASAVPCHCLTLGPTPPPAQVTWFPSAQADPMAPNTPTKTWEGPGEPPAPEILTPVPGQLGGPGALDPEP